MKKPTKTNLRHGLIQARVTIKEQQEILTKAQVYSGGDVSKYVRLACLEYKPLKRVQK